MYSTVGVSTSCRKMTVSKRITKHFIYAIIFYVSVLATQINVNLQKWLLSALILRLRHTYVETQNPDVNATRRCAEIVA